MMTFSLRRNSFTDKGIFGLMFDALNNLVMHTLEHSYQDMPGGSWLPHIAPGTYICKRVLSPHFGFMVWVLQDVPGHTNCEIHKGNLEADSKGCVLCGTDVAGDALTESKKAFDKFMALTANEDTITIMVT